MLLDFIKQDIKNFKSFIGEHAFPLGGDSGLVFVRGRNQIEKRLGANGAGKSSVWQALTWTLYGRTAEGLRNPDVAAWKGDKKTRGCTTIRVDDRKHTIERTASPNKLRIDGKDAGQEAVDKLLRMDYDTFIQTVLFAQGQPLFLDMQPRDKMLLFSTVLDLDKWDRRSTAASGQVRRLEDVESKVLADIAAEEGALDEIEAMTKDLRAKSNAWEIERNQRGQSIEKEMKALKKSLTTVQDAFTSADLAYDGAKTELKLLTKDMEDAREAVAVVKQNAAEEAARADVLHRDVRRYKADIDALGEADACPTCGQSLKGTDLAKHRTELRKLLNELVRKADQQSRASEKANVKVAKVQEASASIRKQWDALEQKARDAGVERDALYPRVAELNAQIKVLEKQGKQSEDETNPYTEQISKLRKRKAKVNNELAELDKELNRTRRTIERSRHWVKGFRDIRLFVVEEVLQEMEIACTVMLEEMGLIGWQILFGTEKETKSGTIQRGIIVTIVSPSNKDPVRWECWSGGEGQRLRLVGALALAEVLLSHANVDPNIEILDEPTRHLSAEGVRDMCEYLADRADRLGKRIFYTDHQAVESSHFASTITIVKDAQGSYVE